MRKLVALALALLALPLVPLGEAANPTSRSWSPYNAPETVSALAMAVSNDTIAAALADLDPTPPCTPPACLPGAPSAEVSALAIFSNAGFERHGSPGVDRTKGRRAVAVSANGDVVASLGNDTSAAAVEGQLQLFYEARRGGTWDTDPLFLKTPVGGVPVGLLVSADGNRVVVATHEGDNLAITPFERQANSLAQGAKHVTPGRVLAIAGSADLARIVVAGSLPLDGQSWGAATVLPFSSPAESTYYHANATQLVAAAMSADGQRVALTSSDGQVLVFGATLSLAPQRATWGNATIPRVALSADGSRLVAARGVNLSAYEVREGAPLERWNATVPGTVNGLSLNRTGGLLVAAVGGASGGAIGFADDGRQVWKLNGDTSAAVVNLDATAIAYAQGTRVLAASLTRGIDLTRSDVGDVGTPLVIAAEATARFPLTLTNTGAAPELVRFRADESVADVVFEPAEVLAAPGETLTVVAFVTPRVTTGTRAFNVTAVAPGSGMTDDTTLAYEIAPVTAITISSNATDVRVLAGEATTHLLEVRNTGTQRVAVALRAQQSAAAPWNIELDPASLPVAANSLSTVRVTITPPASVANGTTNVVTYLLEGANVSDSVSITYRVNPTLGLELTAQTRTQFIEAGKVGFFNITVKNAGSLARSFVAFYDVNESSGRSWGIRMNTQPFELAAGASREITIQVTAPVDARPPDQLKLAITARLVPRDNETELVERLTLFANAAEPIPPGDSETDEGGNVIPAPSLTLALGALGAAALALRRRRAP